MPELHAWGVGRGAHISVEELSQWAPKCAPAFYE